MAFVRTGLIIVALLLSWVAVRLPSAAHNMPPQQASLSQTAAHTAS